MLVLSQVGYSASGSKHVCRTSVQGAELLIVLSSHGIAGMLGPEF